MDALIEYVARKLALDSISNGQWPTAAHLVEVDKRWHEYERQARVAFEAIGSALTEIAKKD